MNDKSRTQADEAVNRETLLNYLRDHPGEEFEEGQLKQITKVHKGFIRGLLRGVAGVDQELLERGKVRWHGEDPPSEHHS